jgi:hypothetical protein
MKNKYQHFHYVTFFLLFILFVPLKHGLSQNLNNAVCQPVLSASWPSGIQVTNNNPDYYFCYGDSCSLNVQPANGAYTYSWYKNGVFYTGGTGMSNLEFKVISDDWYSVLITECGTDSSNHICTHVKPLPNGGITVSPANPPYCGQTNFVLNCWSNPLNCTKNFNNPLPGGPPPIILQTG